MIYYRLVVIMLLCCCALVLVAQVPLTQIEGRLEVYLQEDTTSLHIGKNAGIAQHLDVSRQNIFIGTDAGRSNTSGALNSFYGYKSGYSNEIGYFNCFYGSQSGYSNELGLRSSFYGNQSGYSNTTGGLNNFYGYQSGFSTTTGSQNSMYGNESGYHNTTGGQNVYIGSHTARLINGSGNVFIGYFVGPNDAFSIDTAIINNRLYIHNNHTPDPLIYGEFDNRLLTIHGRQIIERDDVQQLELVNPGPGGNRWRISSSNDNWNAGGGKFLIGTSSNTNNARLIIQGDGNVGVGEINPNATLHIKDVARLTPQTSEPACDNDLIGSIYFDDNTKRLRICTVLNGPSKTFIGWKNLHDSTPD